MNDRRMGLLVVGLMLALVLVTVAVAPGARAGEQQERVCFSCRDTSDFIWGGDLYFWSDERFTQKLHLDGSNGNIDSEGTLDLAGAMDVNGAAVFDGAVSMNVTLDVDGNVSSGTGAFTVTDNVLIDGQADLVQLTVQGYTTQTNDILVVEDYTQTNVFVVNGSGLVNYRIDVSIITTDTVLTAADSGTHIVFKNQDTFQVTATLPAAAAGLNFCFTNYDGDDVQVDAPTGDQIKFLTSATGEEIDNSTAGNWVCLAAIDGTDWVQTSVSGTWSDD